MLEKIKEILVEQLNCDADSINEDTSFKDDLGADSLDLYEMVMALEDEYGIEIHRSQSHKVPAESDSCLRKAIHRYGSTGSHRLFFQRSADYFLK